MKSEERLKAEKEMFVERLEERISFTSSYARGARIIECSEAELKAYKKITAIIKYDCHRCKRQGSSDMRCCYDCYNDVGYLNVLPSDEDTAFMAKLFGSRGFWKKGVGCLLPRELRSFTCLGYNCAGIGMSKLWDWEMTAGRELYWTDVLMVVFNNLRGRDYLRNPKVIAKCVDELDTAKELRRLRVALKEHRTRDELIKLPTPEVLRRLIAREQRTKRYLDVMNIHKWR